MKTRDRQFNRRVRVAANAAFSAAAIAAATFVGVRSASAATKTWDLDSAGHNNGVINNGGGTWSNKAADPNWTTNGGTTNTSFANSGDDAIFGGNPGVGAAGTVTLSGDQTVNSITFDVAASGSFTIAGSNQLVFSVPSTSITQNSAAATTISAPIEGIDTTLTLGGTSAGAVTLSGQLSEMSGSHPLALTKTGSTQYILTNATSSYSGVTNVNGGTLTVNGTIAGSGAFNVNSTGKVGGTGTITKTVNINSGGTLSPAGDGTNSNVGTISTSAHNWAGGSTYVWEIKDAGTNGGLTGAGSSYDTLNVTGQLNINATSSSTMTIKVVSHGAVTGFNANQNWNWIIANASSGLNGTFAVNKFVLDVSDFIDDNPSADPQAFTISQNGNTVRVSYVPEPGATMLAGAGGAMALLRRRRRK